MSNDPINEESTKGEGFTAKLFGHEITIWGNNYFRNIMVFIGASMLLYIMFQTEVNELFSKTFNRAEYEQKEKFSLHHQFISPIITAWDTIHDIDDVSKKNVRLVRDNIDDAVLRYENLKVDKLSMATQITWKYHLARLKVIEADKTSKIAPLDMSVKLLEEAKTNSNDTDNLTVKDMDFINGIQMNTRIKRTLLNSYALMYHISNDASHRILSERILKDVGGCKELISMYFYHEKIANSLGCKI
ncbi:hypothetical protein [Thalassotalea euphylliae]|nr:hypothetical protein [Thalassotalea euphylliae]